MTLSAYRKTLTVLANEALLLAGDPSGERHSLARVYEKLNDAALEFCLRTHVCKDEVNIVLKTDQFEYDVRQFAENGSKKGFGYFYRVGYSGTKEKAFEPSSVFILDISGYSRLDGIAPGFFHLCATSPGVLQVVGPPLADGEAAPSEVDNIQVLYVAMPDYMDQTTDYLDSTIPAYFHQAIPFKAAEMLLEEGDSKDLLLADSMEAEFERFVYEAIGDQHRGQTAYDMGATPL